MINHKKRLRAIRTSAYFERLLPNEYVRPHPAPPPPVTVIPWTKTDGKGLRRYFLHVLNFILIVLALKHKYCIHILIIIFITFDSLARNIIRAAIRRLRFSKFENYIHRTENLSRNRSYRRFQSTTRWFTPSVSLAAFSRNRRSLILKHAIGSFFWILTGYVYNRPIILKNQENTY